MSPARDPQPAGRDPPQRAQFEPIRLDNRPLFTERHRCITMQGRSRFVYVVYVARRRPRRRTEKGRPRPPANPVAAQQVVVREAPQVERLAYTRTQAAEALGVSRSTFNRRVLPLLETVDMPWGARLVPVDELERLLAERRQPAPESRPSPILGRPTALALTIIDRIAAERADGKTLAEIARRLNADGTPTAHGGSQWWPSTVRAVLARQAPLTSA
jgi:hypothetical protein